MKQHFSEAQFFRCMIDRALVQTSCFANHEALHNCEPSPLNKNISGTRSGAFRTWPKLTRRGRGSFLMDSKLSVRKAEPAAYCYHM